MVWKKGESGNPKGNPAIKPFLEALRRALAQDSAERLRQCAETLLDKAAEGEPWAVQMLADRLDGKAQQEIKIHKTVKDLSIDDILAELTATGVATGIAEAQAGAGEPVEVH